MSRSGPSGRGVSRSSHAPTRNRARSPASSRNAWIRLVLPIPASPVITTTPPAPRRHRSSAASRLPSVSSRSSKVVCDGTTCVTRPAADGRDPAARSITVEALEDRTMDHILRRGRWRNRTRYPTQRRPLPPLRRLTGRRHDDQPDSAGRKIMAALPQLTVQPVHSARLDLEPLRVEHAAEAAVVFDDARLHRYIGGGPAGGGGGRRPPPPPGTRPPPPRDGPLLDWMGRPPARGEVVGA